MRSHNHPANLAPMNRDDNPIMNGVSLNSIVDTMLFVDMAKVINNNHTPMTVGMYIIK